MGSVDSGKLCTTGWDKSFSLSGIQFLLCGVKELNSMAMIFCPLVLRGTHLISSDKNLHIRCLLGRWSHELWSWNEEVRQGSELSPESVYYQESYPWEQFEMHATGKLRNNEKQQLSNVLTSIYFYHLNYWGPQEAIVCVAYI